MSALWYRFRAELLARWVPWLAVALLVGLASGAVLALAAGARRTESAYDRFRRSQRAFDVLVVNNRGGVFPGESGTAIIDLNALAALPQVADSARVHTFFVSVGAGVGAYVAPDDVIGTRLNRFEMLEGRRIDPSRPDEAVVGFTFAEQYGIDIGDEIELIDPAYADIPVDAVPPAFHEAVDRVLGVLPDAKVRVVGIEASPGEFPPQIEGSGRYLVHVSPALYPVRAALAGLSDGGDSLMVRLEPGADTDAFVAEVERLSGREPPDLLVQGELTDTVNRSFRTQTAALGLLALLTAAVGVLIIGQVVGRLTAIESADNGVLAALGVSRGQRVGLALIRAAVIGAVGALVAVMLAVALSPVFPTALARTAEPDPGVRLDGGVLLMGAVAVVVAVIALTTWPAWRAARSTMIGRARRAAATRPSWVGRLLGGRATPLPAELGMRMALEPGYARQAVPVRSGLLVVTLGVVTLVAAFTFGASLAHLLDAPRLYGKTWDVELTTYDEAMVDDGVPVLADDGRVEAIAVGVLRFPFQIEGKAIDGISLETVQGDLAPVILEGRAPGARNEIALGTRTLRSLDVDVGDTVDVGIFATQRDPIPMRIVGRAVFPVFAEAGRLGDGAYVDAAGGDQVYGERVPSHEKSVLVSLRSDVGVDEVVRDLRRDLGETTTVFVIDQGKPTDIVNFGRVEATPYLLGAILAALSIATLAYLLASAVRRRRRELAVLKTLGFVRGQVRTTVAWQASTLIAIALLVGVPVGVATGRWIWTAFAEYLGVVGQSRTPWLAVAILVPAAFVVANVVAGLPARSAARTRPAAVLRTE